VVGWRGGGMERGGEVDVREVWEGERDEGRRGGAYA